MRLDQIAQTSGDLRFEQNDFARFRHADNFHVAQRGQLQERAAQAKAALGAPILDGTRAGEILAQRRDWANELRLDGDGTVDVFRAIITMSRRAQRT